MYGTIARLKLKPGIDALARIRALRATVTQAPPGAVAEYIFAADRDPNEIFLVVMFDSREAYRANSENPATSARFQEIAAMLAEPPDWHDGEVIYHEIFQPRYIRP